MRIFFSRVTILFRRVSGERGCTAPSLVKNEGLSGRDHASLKVVGRQENDALPQILFPGVIGLVVDHAGSHVPKERLSTLDLGTSDRFPTPKSRHAEVKDLRPPRHIFQGHRYVRYGDAVLRRNIPKVARAEYRRDVFLPETFVNDPVALYGKAAAVDFGHFFAKLDFAGIEPKTHLKFARTSRRVDHYIPIVFVVQAGPLRDEVDGNGDTVARAIWKRA